MTLLTPLGLLALLGIAVLILIYILKPNYQQKFISSTYVWKLSLNYRKKKLPTSKLRNLLIIICQVLIIASCATILAQPVKLIQQEKEDKEVIAIIDSSASMRTDDGDGSRFEKAVNKVIDLSENVFTENGYISVIMADNDPEFLINRVGKDDQTQFIETMEGLTEGSTKCGFGSSDIDSSITLCNDILKENPGAQVYLYTDIKYSFIPSNIKVVNLSQEGEWNSAILNAYAETEDNYYSFYIDVASYGRDSEIKINIDVYGANSEDKNDEGVTISFSGVVECNNEQAKTVIFRYPNDSDENIDVENQKIIDLSDLGIEKIFSFQSIHISLDENDSFTDDNDFDIYGGQKEVLKVQYFSTIPNSFFNSVLLVLKSAYANRWDIQITEVKKGGVPETEGFDFYIFEHSVPETLPTDGVLLLVDPNIDSSDAGISLRSVVSLGQSISLTQEKESPLLNNVTADNITVSRYTCLSEYDPSYQVLMSCDTNPVLLARKEEGTQIAIMLFSLHYSNLPLLIDFPMLMKNMFDYYMPSTIEGNYFEVNESVSINSRSPILTITGNGETTTFDQFPASYTVSTPGTYEVSQMTYFDKEINESIYVKIPSSESNIFETSESLKEPYKEETKTELFSDLIFYIAMALVILLFAEWWLSSREGM